MLPMTTDLVLETASPGAEQTIRIDALLQCLELLVVAVALHNRLVIHGIVDEVWHVHVRGHACLFQPLRHNLVQPVGKIASDLEDLFIFRCQVPGSLENQDDTVRVRSSETHGVAALGLRNLANGSRKWLHVNAELDATDDRRQAQDWASKVRELITDFSVHLRARCNVWNGFGLLSGQHSAQGEEIGMLTRKKERAFKRLTV